MRRLDASVTASAGTPPRRVHGADDILLRALEADIDRIARQPEGGAGRHLEPGQRRLSFEMAPDERREQVGESAIEHERDRRRERGHDKAAVDLSCLHPGEFGADPGRGQPPVRARSARRGRLRRRRGGFHSGQRKPHRAPDWKAVASGEFGFT